MLPLHCSIEASKYLKSGKKEFLSRKNLCLSIEVDGISGAIRKKIYE